MEKKDFFQIYDSTDSPSKIPLEKTVQPHIIKNTKKKILIDISKYLNKKQQNALQTFIDYFMINNNTLLRLDIRSFSINTSERKIIIRIDFKNISFFNFLIIKKLLVELLENPKENKYRKSLNILFNKGFWME